MRFSLAVRRVLALSSIALCLTIAVLFKSGIVPVAGTKPAGTLGISGVTKSVAEVPGQSDGDGKADPGETLEYTVTITGNGTQTTNVQMSDVLSNLTTLSGSANILPNARDNAFDAIGNVQLVMPDDPASDLLANDADLDGGTITLTGFGDTLATANASAPGTTVNYGAASPLNGASLTVNANGSFNFNPPRGFSGTQKFYYTVSDGQGGTDTAEVTITVNGTIWFINPAAAADGDGRFTSPYKNLGTFNTINIMSGGGANPDNGDTIFLYSGNHAATLSMRASQKVIGQGASDTILTIASYTAASGTNQLPSTGGTSPVITTSANGIELNSNNTIRGLTVGNVNSYKILGTNFGTLTVGKLGAPDVVLSGSGQAIRLVNGSFAATSGFASVANTTNTIGEGILLTTVGGTVSFGSTNVTAQTSSSGIYVSQSTVDVNFGNTTVTAGTNGVRLESNSAGTRTFGTLTISGGTGVGFLHASGGGAVTTTGLMTINNPVGTGFSVDGSNANLSFAGLTVNKANTNGTAVNIVNSSGRTFSFGNLNITTLDGAGIVTNIGGTITSTGGSIAAGGFLNGLAGSFANTALNLTFTSVSSAGGANGLVFGSGTSGSFTSGTTNLQNSTAVGLSMNTSTVNANFGNTTVNSSGNTAVNLASNSGNITFADLDLTPDATFRALDASNNTGTITSTSGDIAATGNAAISITGTSAVSRTPLAMTLNNVDSTNSINFGVVLSNVSGNLTVNDPGVATNIQNPTNTGISIQSTGAGTINLGNTTVNGSGNANADDAGTGVFLTNNSGNVTFAALNITPDSGERSFYATDTDAATTAGTITTSSGTMSSTNDSVLEIAGASAAARTPIAMTLTSVSANGGTNIGMILKNTSASGTFTITGSGTVAASGGTFNAIGGADAVGTGAAPTAGTGIYLESAANVSLSNLSFTGAFTNFGIRGESVNNFTLRESAFTGTFGSNNNIDEAAIRFGTQLGATGTPAGSTGLTGTALFEGNTIGGGWEDNLATYVYGSNTLNITVRDTVGGDQAVFTNNDITNGNDGFFLESGGTSSVTVNVNGVTFNGARGDLLQVLSVGSAVQTITIQNNTFHNAHTNIITGGGGIAVTGGGTNINIDYLISGNSFKGMRASAIFSSFGGVSGTISGFVSNNTMGTANGVYDTLQANRGSMEGMFFFGGIDAKQLGSTGNINYPIRIEGNTIRDVNGIAGILFRSNQQDSGGQARVEATIANNTMAEMGPNIAGGIYMQPGGASLNNDKGTLGANISSNNINFSVGGAAASGDAIVFDQASVPATFYMPGYTSAPSADPNTLASFLTGAKGNVFTNAQVSGTGGVLSNTSAVQNQNFTQTIPSFANLEREGMEEREIERAAIVPAYKEPSELIASLLPDLPTERSVEVLEPMAVKIAADVVVSHDIVASAGEQFISPVLEGAVAVETESISELTESGPTVGDLVAGLLNVISPTAEAAPAFAGETVNKGPFTLPANETAVIKFRVTVGNGPYAAGVNAITNTANITADGGVNMVSNTSSIELDAAPDLSLTVSDGNLTTEPGKTVQFTTTYANGNAANGQGATGVVVTQTVPANTTFNAAVSGAGWSCANGSPAGTTCNYTVGNLAANSSASLNFAVDVLAALPAGVISITDSGAIADDGGNGTDLNTANNTSGTETTPIIGNWLGTTSTDWHAASNWSNNQIPPAGNNISVPDVANQPAVLTQDATVGVLTLNDDMSIAAGRTVTATGNVTLGTKVVSGAGTLELGTASAITRTTGQVNAALKKNFAATGAFVFPVGTGTPSNEYSPLNVNITAGTGSLSVRASKGTVTVTPAMDPTKTLQRFWSLEGSGITADLTFNYLQSDVAGTEANYKLMKVAGGFRTSYANAATCPASGSPCVNTSANTMFISGVSSFSDWTASELEPQVPTAAAATVSGQVLGYEGRGNGLAIVMLTDDAGNVRYAKANTFGYFRFVDVEAGRSYVISVTDKRHRYAASLVGVDADVAGIVLTPEQ